MTRSPAMRNPRYAQPSWRRQPRCTLDRTQGVALYSLSWGTSMNVQPPIDFWFSIASTYTYLSVMRLAEVEQRTGAQFRCRPFNVRSIMVEQNNIPFRTKPVKLAYMAGP